MIEFNLYKSPKDGRTCAHVTASTSDDNNAYFYSSGYGMSPDKALEYARALNAAIGQEIVVTGDKILIDDLPFKQLIKTAQ